MKGIRAAVVLLGALAVSGAAVLAGQSTGTTDDQAAIRQAVWGFIDGAFNKREPDAVLRNVHQDYLRLANVNNRLRVSSRYAWLEMLHVPALLGTGRSEEETVRFLDVFAAGNIGFAEVECVLKGELHGTDYFFLTRFADGWKLVGSIDQQDAPEVRAAPEADREKDRAAIRTVIQDAYVDGLQNWGSMEAVKTGIHPLFQHLILGRDGTLLRRNLETWISNVERSKAANPGGSKVKVTARFLDVKVLGGIGYARFELARDGKPTFIDTMLLMKFKEGWRIVMKQAHALS